MRKNYTPSRRQFIGSLASASMLLPGMLHELMAETTAPANPLAPRAPMFPAKAKRVIFLYMSGGVSHVDTFDPKPLLTRDHGKPYFGSAEGSIHGAAGDFLHGSPWAFNRYAKCDTEVSELFPHMGAMMDDVCLIRSMKNDSPTTRRPCCRSTAVPPWKPRPSIGSWMSYGSRHRQSGASLLHRPRAGDSLRRSHLLGLQLPSRLPPGHPRHTRPGSSAQHQSPDLARNSGDGSRPHQLLQPEEPRRAWRRRHSRRAHQDL